jgi:hypothetical protein
MPSDTSVKVKDFCTANGLNFETIAGLTGGVRCMK